MTAPAPASPLRMPPFVLLAISLLAGMGIFVVVVGIGTVLAFVATGTTDPRMPSATLLIALLVVNVLASIFAGLATSKMTRAHSMYTILLLAIMLSMSAVVPLVRGSANPGETQWYLVARPIVIFAGILAGGALQRMRWRTERAD